MNDGIGKPTEKFSHINDNFRSTYEQLHKRDFPIYFDVDGTLLSFTDTINYPLLNVARKLNEMGYKLILWSYGGESWARRFAQISKSEDIWHDILGKPGVLVDDHVAKDILNFGTHIYPKDAERLLISLLRDGEY